MENEFGVLFLVLFGATVLYFAYKIVRHGGWRGAVFGANVDRTVGEINVENRGPVSTVLRVHLLRRTSTERLVGIELAMKSFASYQMMPITLSFAEAQRLASLLQDAARLT